MSDEYQRLLFGSDDDAKADDEARRARIQQREEYRKRRQQAWDSGQPFPEDSAKYHAFVRGPDPTPMLRFAEMEMFGDRWRWAWDWAHPKFYLARWDRWAKDHAKYKVARPWVLAYIAKRRAEALGCRIGRQSAILRRYRFACSEEVILCYWCLRPTEQRERHVDHKQPLVGGGAHAGGNLCVACWACNIAKRDLDPKTFAKLVEPRRLENVEMLRSIGGISGKAASFWDDFFGR